MCQKTLHLSIFCNKKGKKKIQHDLKIVKSCVSVMLQFTSDIH